MYRSFFLILLSILIVIAFQSLFITVYHVMIGILICSLKFDAVKEICKTNQITTLSKIIYGRDSLSQIISPNNGAYSVVT